MPSSGYTARRCSSHDDDRVLEVDPVAQTICQMPVFKHLEENVEHVGMGFLDLIQQDHRVRMPLDFFRQLATFLVTDISGGRADQLRDRMLLHVLGHVKADQRRITAKQHVCQRPRQLGLANSGRTKKHKASDRAIGRLQTGPGTADGAGQRGDRGFLADDATMELLLQVEKLGALVLGDGSERYSGPLRDDDVDVALVDLHLTDARLHVELLADELQVLPGQHLLLAKELRTLVVLLRRRALHLLDGHPNTLVDLAKTPRCIQPRGAWHGPPLRRPSRSPYLGESGP